jgi:Domain of unknown function (DUF4373)
MKFFSHDTDTRVNRKLRKVLRTHGSTGYAIWWALLEELYRADEDGFTIHADDLWLEQLAESLCISDPRTLTRVFDTFSGVGLISSQMWAEHQIFVEAIAERGDAYIKKKSQDAARKSRSRERSKSEKSQNVPRDTPVTPSGHFVTPPDVTRHIQIHESDPENILEEYPERACARAAEDDRPEENRPVSPPPPSFSFSEINPDESREQDEKPISRNTYQGGVENTFINENTAHANTAKLVYGGASIHKTMDLVAIGTGLNLWDSQQALAGFQRALIAELGRLGRKEPARALSAIFKGVERRSEPEIKEIRSYWDRFDGQAIISDPPLDLPWVESDGSLNKDYENFVRINPQTLDGLLPNGRYKFSLILQTNSDNKFARGAWADYQAHLEREAWREGAAEREAKEEAFWAAERAAHHAKIDQEIAEKVATNPNYRAERDAYIAKGLAEYEAKKAMQQSAWRIRNAVA